MAIFGLVFIFLMTTLGSSFVFFFKSEINDKINKIFLGIASGIMMSASIWSLLVPAIGYAEEMGLPSYFPTSIGFLFGALFLFLLDKLIKSFNKEKFDDSIKKRTTKFFMAVALHNIPEGLAVGLAFGLAIHTNDMSAMMGAVMFAAGIGIQNIPEGCAISLPMLEVTKSKPKAFFMGVLSGIVEPIFGLIGLLLASYIWYAMPYALSFAAGTMIYVIVEEMIPEAVKGNNKGYGTWSVIIGFIIMMILDLALG